MKSSYFLTSLRLGFRTWSREDLDLALELWGDFQVTRLFDGRGPLDGEAVAQRLERELESQSRHGVQYWPIFLLESHAHVGCAGFRPHDPARGILEMGIHIRPEFWRRGLGVEAGRALIPHAFHTLDAQGIFAGHNPENTGSRKLLAHLGFQYSHDEFYEPTGLHHPSYLLRPPAR
ncbi:MAG: GNAT family N-acetyltransferase [Desulfobacterales bacterium]|nr:GNAT family N-acetyltransferase [Desulfobacterales bacterium]